MTEVNPDLRAHLEALRAKAAFKGTNLWDVLHAAGLLFTEDVRRAHRAHAVRQAAEALEARSMPQLVGGAYVEGRTTAKDMRRGITEFLHDRVEYERRGGRT